MTFSFAGGGCARFHCAIDPGEREDEVRALTPPHPPRLATLLPFIYNPSAVFQSSAFARDSHRERERAERRGGQTR